MTQSTLETAKKIVQKLRNAGYQAYFVGGSVRDMLLDRPIEEVDIATNASPTIVTTIFPDTLSIGAAFGIIAVKENGQLFEVATFRSDEDYADGRHPNRVIFASMKDDAIRRDFTINGMYYDPFEEKLFDLVEGRADLERKVVRAIGHPKQRFLEDKLRILRAIRFAATLGFSLDPKTEIAIIKEAPSLPTSVSPERIWQELKKMLRKAPYESLQLLIKLKVLPIIFPELKASPSGFLRSTIAFAQRIRDPHIPEIAFLLPLFQEVKQEEAIAAFSRLKVSNKELGLLEDWYEALPQFRAKQNNKIFWAHFFASQTSSLLLSLFLSLQRTPHEQELFISRVHHLKTRLASFIERIQTGSPLVSAPDLMARGIAPGRLLGELLKEAEALSIEHECSDKEKILSLLKDKGFWK
jgi:tRNA nucleotidyltransferase/poly(A) polymerase